MKHRIMTTARKQRKERQMGQTQNAGGGEREACRYNIFTEETKE
jgi:hypothetical protein